MVARWGLAFLVALFATTVDAARYFTWVDENGRVQRTLIPEEANPLIKGDKPAPLQSEPPVSPVSADDVRGAQAKEALPVVEPSAAPEATSEPLAPTTRLESTQESVPADNELRQASPPPVIRESAPSSAIVPAASAERRPDDSERKTGAEVAPSRDPEYNTDNYIDGDELEKRGFIRGPEDRPHFTWRDADGTLRSEPYTPEHAQAQGFTAKAAAKDGVIYTLAVIETFGGANPLPAGADSGAASLLGLDQVLAPPVGCCAELADTDIEIFEADNPAIGFEFANNTPNVTLPEGESPVTVFRLLPSLAKSPMRLRSFIKSGQVVSPTLMFLDEKFTPVQRISKIDYLYIPENWKRWGYLEAVINVPDDMPAIYLVVYVSREEHHYLKTTVGEMEGTDSKQVRFVPVGSLELKYLTPED